MPTQTGIARPLLSSNEPAKDELRPDSNPTQHPEGRLQGLGIFRAYSELMNLQGYEGNFAPDYATPLSDEERNVVKSVTDGAMPQ